MPKHILVFLMLAFAIPSPVLAAEQQQGLMGVQQIEPPGMMKRIKAMMGDSTAQAEMGIAYAIGAGVDRSMIEARQWWEKSANSGNVEAQYALGLLYVGTGYDGVSQDFGTAATWFAKAAQEKYSWAEYSLGYLYDMGLGFPKNDKLAGQAYLAAAAEGNEYAQFNVGLMYETGQGTEQNHVEAIKWFRKAAQQGNAHAAYFLGKMFEEGTAIQTDLELAGIYYRRAADDGVAAAQTKIGDFYYDGRGGFQKSPEQSIIWYRKAADQSDVTAAILLARMYDDGVGVTKDPAEALRLSRLSMKAANNKPVDYRMGLESFEHFLTRKKIEDDAIRAVKEKENQGGDKK